MTLPDLEYKTKLFEYLCGFISENKKKLFSEYIEFRTRYITVVMEDIYQPHNASAVLRSCDCFGIQDLHIIENKYKYIVNPDVALGSSKWVDIIKYNSNETNTLSCIKQLKHKGYKIVATTPHHNDINLDQFPIDQKFALFFGKELDGLSSEALEHADQYLKIPMFGFTESFNLSVSAAIILYQLTKQLRLSDVKWQLNETDRIDTLLSWARSVIKKVDLHIQEFRNNTY